MLVKDSVAEVRSDRFTGCDCDARHSRRPGVVAAREIQATAKAAFPDSKATDFMGISNFARCRRLTEEAARGTHSNVSTNERTTRTTPVLPLADLCDVPCFNQDVVAQVRASMPSDEALDDIRTRFAALADRTRLKVLFALIEGSELCVCDVAHAVDMSVSAASHHLRKLRDLKILKYRNDGKMAYYSLADRSVAKLVRQAFDRSAA